MSLALTSADYTRARRLLMRRDPTLGAIIREFGPCLLEKRPAGEPFAALIRAITAQQVSSAAATAIHTRLLALVPGGRPTPSSIAALTDDELRGVGLSRQKVGYLRDLCEKARDGIDLDQLAVLPDDEVVGRLTRIKGIGRWTAEMFLMFTLKRPDVFPADDLGIRNAVQRAYRLRRPPTAARLTKLAEAWRPYRTVASWYLWRSLENTPW